jgi:hypothetical protein
MKKPFGSAIAPPRTPMKSAVSGRGARIGPGRMGGSARRWSNATSDCRRGTEA